jgi:hypothetical protein
MSDDVKDSFYEQLGRVFDQFRRYDMIILLGDFNAPSTPIGRRGFHYEEEEDFNVKVHREDIFKLTIRNESSHEISNDNGVRVVNFATSENSKALCSLSAVFINISGPLLMERHTTRLITF